MSIKQKGIGFEILDDSSVQKYFKRRDSNLKMPNTWEDYIAFRLEKARNTFKVAKTPVELMLNLLMIAFVWKNELKYG